MEPLVIRGGNSLFGTVEINGAKNAVLPILAATILHGGTYAIHNCPDITDVKLASEIIEALGGQVCRRGRLLLVDTSSVFCWKIPAALMGKMRASVLFLGSLLGRFGRAVLTMPGGCPLGRRPIDMHLDAMAHMGTVVTLQEGEIRCEAERLHGAEICFPYPSVGATENALLAATACNGCVVLQNAAQEPEIADLAAFLQTMGADIRGAGTPCVTICGGAALSDVAYGVMPDRIETATYLCAAAACGGDVTLLRTEVSHVEPVVHGLTEAGCRIDCGRDGIRIRSDGALRGVGTIETAPYPGFPTDAQALMMASMLRARGDTRFSETVFERRFGHVPQLRRFGGQIETSGASAVVHGVQRLYGAQAEGTDLRATAALILAALQTPEESRICGINHLHRGYDNLEGNLRALGADIMQ